MRKIFSFLFMLSVLSASAQSDVIINRVTYLIADGKYNDAEQYLDSLIKADPKSIDALMMKGNVLLNYEIMTDTPLNNISVEDESIYSPQLALLKEPTVLVPRDKALKVEKLWKQCIAMDSARIDMHKGICSLYGYADMSKELLDYLPLISSKAKGKKEDVAYTLLDYSRLLNERGDKQGAYEVCKKIAALYPTVPGVWCYLSTMYYRNGDLPNAKIYADKGAAVPKLDMAVCGDALEIYTAVGEPEKIIAALKNAAKDTLFKDYPFYDAIYKYGNHDKNWKAEMQQYVKQFSTPQDSNPVYQAALVLLDPAFKEDYKGFETMLRFSLTDFYVAQVAQRAMQDFKDSLHPPLVMAQVYIHCRNYAKANAIYASLAAKKITGELKIDYQLQYAYSLYCAGEYTKAIVIFSELSKSDIAFLINSSNYFIGTGYLKMGDKAKAREYLNKLIALNDESKYGFLAKLRLDRIRQEN